MIRSLLVGVDGSPNGEAALALGITWAQRHDALLVGLGIVDDPDVSVLDKSLIGPQFLERLEQELPVVSRRHVDQILERCALQCATAGVAFKPLEDSGTPYIQILLEAQRYDLILLGQETHFRFGWRSEGDDTLSQVLAAMPRPLVVVPPHLPTYESILVAYDGSLPAARTLAAFEASGIARDRQIDVLCVMADGASATRHAERAVDFLASHQVKAIPHILTQFNGPAEAILNWAEQIEAGLLVMGAYGQPILRQFFLGSVTRTVLKHSPIPVFLYH